MDAFQDFQPFLHLRRILARRGNHCRVKLRALHAGRHQQVTIGAAQLIQLPLDHAPDRFWQFAPEVRHRSDQGPTSLVLNDHSGVAQITEQIDHEKWIALGPGVEDGREFFRELVPGKGQLQVAVQVIPIQERQIDLAAYAPPLEFQLDRPKGMLVSQKVGRTEGDHQQQSPLRTLVAEISQKVDTRWVSPVNIVQEHHQRKLSRHFVQ